MTHHGTIKSPLELSFNLSYSVEPGQSPKLPNFSDEVGEPGYDAEADILQLNFISVQVRDGHREVQLSDGSFCRVTKYTDVTLNLSPEVKAEILQALLEVPHLAHGFADEAIEAEADQ